MSGIIISPLGLCKAQLKAGLCSAFVCYVFIFNDFCLNMCWTDLHEICLVGRSMAVDERSEVSFLITQGALLWQPIFFGLSASVHRIGFVWHSLPVHGGVYDKKFSDVLDAGEPVNWPINNN